MNQPNLNLTNRISLAEFRRKYDRENGARDFIADVEKLESQILAGDELWEFAPGEDTIPVWGVAIVRNSEIVDFLIDGMGTLFGSRGDD